MAEDIYFNPNAQNNNYRPVRNSATNPYVEQVDSLPQPVRAPSAPASYNNEQGGSPDYSRIPAQNNGRNVRRVIIDNDDADFQNQPPYSGADNTRSPQRRTAEPRRRENPADEDAPKKKNPAPVQKKKRKKHKGFVVFLALILILALLATTAAAAIYGYVLNDYKAEALADNVYTDEAALASSASVYNILLMGIDSASTQDSSRSDSMMILSIDSKSNKIKLTSVMRDSFVYIPNDEWAKLNAACSKGGPQLVVDTIEYNFGIKIDAYLKIGYEMLVDLVDGIGGITVPEITEAEAQYMGYEGVTVVPGTNVHLDGQQTLQFCRIRKDAATSDFRRTERQREALSLIIKKALKTNPATLMKLAKRIIGECECSISKGEILTLAFRILPCLMGDIVTGRVPADGTYGDGSDAKYGSVLTLDLEANKAYLKDFIYG